MITMDTKKGSSVLGMSAPDKSCTDQKCPFHGQLAVKNELFTGKIIKRDTNRSATLEWNKSVFVPKYERYEVRRYRLRVHNPGCLDAHIGDKVVAAKTRPLSKTKNLVIIQVVTRGEEVEATSGSSKTEGVKKEGKVKVKK